MHTYFCLSAQLAMKKLLKAKSVVLTSGTLGCLSTLSTCLGITFQIQQKFDHIISRDRLLALSVSKGPDGQTLKFSYAERDNVQMIISLGRTLINVARIVPFGVLVFFTSYKMLELCKVNWSSGNVWKTLCDVKRTFVETKDSAEFEQTITEFRKFANQRKGAILFAVARGRASEGIDFRGNHARTVIMVGLPYASRFDPKLEAKIKLLDESKAKNKECISGMLWYEDQMYKAIGQAAGRLIRSRNDFGVLLLIDNRFTFPSVKARLPKWIQNSMRNQTNFGSMLCAIKNLFLRFTNQETSEEKVEYECHQESLSQQEANTNNQQEIKDDRKRNSTIVSDAFDNSDLFTQPQPQKSTGRLSTFFNEQPQTIESSRKKFKSSVESSFDEVIEQRRRNMKAKLASAKFISKLDKVLTSEQLIEFKSLFKQYHINDSNNYDTFKHFVSSAIVIFGNQNRTVLLMLKPFICVDFRLEFEQLIEKATIENM